MSGNARVVAAVGGAVVLVAIVVLNRCSPPVNSPPARSIELPTESPASSATPAPPPTPTPVPPSLPEPPAADATRGPIDELEQWLVDLTNEQRTRAALRPLDREAGLSAAARSHSEDMLRRGFFDHVNPDRQSPADRVARYTGQPAGAIGENIWSWSGSIPPDARALVEQAVAEWMASPAHRVNILRPGYTRLGVGAAASASEVRLTELFME